MVISSMLLEANVFPSGLNATEVTALECPVRAHNSLPLAASHNLTVWSSLPEASISPSGLYATDKTCSECPACTTSSGFCANAITGCKSSARKDARSNVRYDLLRRCSLIPPIVLSVIDGNQRQKCQRMLARLKCAGTVWQGRKGVKYLSARCTVAVCYEALFFRPSSARGTHSCMQMDESESDRLFGDKLQSLFEQVSRHNASPVGSVLVSVPVWQRRAAAPLSRAGGRRAGAGRCGFER